jgi:hypothetical protein
LGKFSKEFADIGVFNLDARAALIVFDSDLAFSAEAIRSTRVVSFPLVSSPLRNAWRSGTQGALP